MKKALIFSIIILVLCGSCFAQNTNNAQRIIGTWVDPSGNTTWVFNANGTLTQTWSSGESSNYKFGVTETMLYFDRAYSYSISSDGKTLILVEYSSYFSGYWLTRR